MPVVKLLTDIFLFSLGRRNADLRKGYTNNPQQNQSAKVIGTSAALNSTTDPNKKTSNKKKSAKSGKTGNDTTPTNLARVILSNLNIFGKA